MSKSMVLIHPQFGEIKGLMIKGELHFVMSDVCSILDIRNPRDAFSRLDEDEKGVANADTPGGKQEVNVINESGLYHLVMVSRKPEAKVFRKWVTKEVLPAIRSTGFYVHPNMRLTMGQRRKLEELNRILLKKNLTDQDLVRCARRTGRTFKYVESVLCGYCENRGVMEELQRMAIENNENRKNPYSIESMQMVIEKLNR